MTPLAVVSHLLNLFAPALFTAALVALFAKLLWRDRLRSVSWRRLAGWGALASAAALLAGLVLLGSDGRVATYASMVLANAVALWWAGFGPSRRRTSPAAAAARRTS